PMSDIDQLILPDTVRQVLVENSFFTIQSVANVSAEDLAERTGLSAEDAALAHRASEAFLRVQKAAPVA
ncbi:MAG: hypothetical protein KDD44_14790, partial [Bdellovibrionales bacterium]|nr:hypothetical protein [Bdellovibrionales bacterium]